MRIKQSKYLVGYINTERGRIRETVEPDAECIASFISKNHGSVIITDDRDEVVICAYDGLPHSCTDRDFFFDELFPEIKIQQQSRTEIQ